MDKNLLRVVDKISDLIGYTPIFKIKLKNEVSLFLKLEQFNPTGSTKIRMAKNMIDVAISENMAENGKFVESTSGNTGMGLALVAAEQSLSFTAIVDDHASKDKLNCMKSYGAKILYVGEKGKLATGDRDAKAAALAKEEGAFWTEQHNNPANLNAYSNLAEEIYIALNGKIDCLFGAIGTGGSLCGTAKFLLPYLPKLKVYAVEPDGSIIFNKPAHSYFQSGTGTPAGAEVGCLINYEMITQDFQVTDSEAFETCRYLARKYGLLVGGSAGGVIYKALEYAHNCPDEKNIVILVSDGGEKYLGTIFNDDWMAENHLLNDNIQLRLEYLLS